MSALIDLDEIQMVLGLQNKTKEIEVILREHSSNSFLSAISNIILNSNPEELVPKASLSAESEMYVQFTEYAQINQKSEIVFEENNKKSVFVNGIKCENKKQHKGKVGLSNHYLNKVKGIFTVEEEKKEEDKKENESNVNSIQNNVQQSDIEIIESNQSSAPNQGNQKKEKKYKKDKSQNHGGNNNNNSAGNPQKKKGKKKPQQNKNNNNI